MQGHDVFSPHRGGPGPFVSAEPLLPPAYVFGSARVSVCLCVCVSVCLCVCVFVCLFVFVFALLGVAAQR